MPFCQSTSASAATQRSSPPAATIRAPCSTTVKSNVGATTGTVSWDSRTPSLGEPTATWASVCSRLRSGEDGAVSCASPGQNTVVPLDELCDPAALDLLDAGKHFRHGDSSLRQVIGHDEERNLLRDDGLDVADHVRALDRAAAEAQALRVLVRDDVVHGVAAEQNGDVRAAVLHGVREPYAGGVLFFDRSSIGAVDDAQVACHRAPHSVPIMRTPSEPSLYFHASTGDPRQGPST